MLKRSFAPRRIAICLLALALLVGLWACAEEPPPLPLTIGEICRQEPGTPVVAEGYLALPEMGMYCEDGQCRINFYEPDVGLIPVEFVTSRGDNPGTLTMPPNPYTLDDMEVTLDDGTVADRHTRVRISGPVRSNSDRCYMEAYAIERS